MNSNHKCRIGGENLRRKVGTWERFKKMSRLKHIKPK